MTRICGKREIEIEVKASSPMGTAQNPWKEGNPDRSQSHVVDPNERLSRRVRGVAVCLMSRSLRRELTRASCRE